ncbi:type III PLP-dependent enzyme [Streptomyces sp. AA0539]|uniref:type III PLP-dependent enzyme n=1 Tax=Streptomyces sp. AA0539 TaxID=1210045 RepID=UPI0003125E6E|nr:type III PLP-dependent enzyme [Streptomyces sp. AA0539]
MSDQAHIQGIPITELVEQFGSPLYLYDGDVLHTQFHTLRNLLHPAIEVFYSLKANPNLSVCTVLHGYGAGAEVSSLTELITARRAGVPPQDIIFLGPGKSRAELAACLDEGVHAIICESVDELSLIDELARERGVTAPVALRVNPDLAVRGGGLSMGGKPRQFGIDEAQLPSLTDVRKSFRAVRLVGIHVYLGTRILRAEVVVENTTRILALAERLADRLDIPLELVDVGGGLGVAYFDGEADLDITTLTSGLNTAIESFHSRHPEARLIMELGRYLTAPAGTYVVRVRYVKASFGENFAVADGGTNHHMAAVGGGSFVKRNFPMQALTRLNEPSEGPWHITGPLCTPNDTLGKNVPMPALRAGDLIGVRRSGAYGPTASPVHFLSHGYPAEVLVQDGRPYLIRERDQVDDLLRRQPRHPALATPQTVGATTAN